MHFPHPQIVLGHRAHSSLSLPPPPWAGVDGGKGLSQVRNLLAAPSPGQTLEGDIPSRCPGVVTCADTREAAKRVWLLHRHKQSSEVTRRKLSKLKTNNLAWTENRVPGLGSPLMTGDMGGGSRHS